MIKIQKLTDIWKSENIPKYICTEMELQLLQICKENILDDISSIGVFFFVESKQDLDNYRQMGMTERIEDASPDFIKRFKDNNTPNVCIQGRYALNDNYVISVFCEEEFLKN